MKLEKNGIIKEIIGEKEIGDYISAGWKEKQIREEKKVIFPKSKELEK